MVVEPRIGLAVIGPGAIADAHLAAFAAIGGVEPLWAVGRTTERTRDFADRWGIDRVSTRIEEALADERVCLALICSPNALHVSQAEACLAAGRDVMLEIPIAMNAKQAQGLVRLAQDQGRRLFACHTMRSFAGIRRMHELVRSGEEEITQIQGFFAIPRRNNEGFTGTRTWIDDLLWHHACHLVDASMWVTGSQEISDPWLIRGRVHPQFGMTMDLNLAFAMPAAGQGGTVIASHALTYNASELSWQLRFVGCKGDYLFDTGRLTGPLLRGAALESEIRNLVPQNEQVLYGLRTQSPTDFDAEGVLPAMQALNLLQEVSGSG